MVSRTAAELSTAFVTAALGLAVMIGSLENGIGWSSSGPEAGAFPFYAGVLVIAGSLGTLVQALRQRATSAVFIDREQARRVLGFFAPIVAFVFASVWLGLYVATALYLFFVMWLQGKYPVWRSALTGIATALAFYVILEVWFQVPLLKGPLEAVLGIH